MTQSSFVHELHIRHDATRRPDESGLFWRSQPNGYSSVACSCGLSNQGVTADMKLLFEIHRALLERTT
jgi:hypothetical protein